MSMESVIGHDVVRASESLADLNAFWVIILRIFFGSTSLPSLFFDVFSITTSSCSTLHSLTCLVMFDRDSIPIGSLH